MGAVWDLAGDILSATVYTGRTAAQVCLLGISLFVILRGEADHGACSGAGHVLYWAAARQDVDLKSPRFHFLQNVGSFYFSQLFVFPPAAFWLIEWSEKTGDLDSIMLPTSTPPCRITKSLPLPPSSPPLPDRRVIFLFPAEPLCAVALQKRKEKKKKEAGSSLPAWGSYQSPSLLVPAFEWRLWADRIVWNDNGAVLLTGVLLLPSQGNGQVENREHHGPAIISEQVSDDGGRDGRVAGFSDTHESSGENEEPVVLWRQKKRFRVSPISPLQENMLNKSIIT